MKITKVILGLILLNMVKNNFLPGCLKVEIKSGDKFLSYQRFFGGYEDAKFYDQKMAEGKSDFKIIRNGNSIAFQNKDGGYLFAKNDVMAPYNIYFSGKKIDSTSLWIVSKHGSGYKMLSKKYNKYAQNHAFLGNNFNLDFVGNGALNVFSINCVEKEKVKEVLSILPCKKITFQLYTGHYLYTMKNNQVLADKSKKSIYEVEMVGKKYSLKDQNGNYLRPLKEKYYKDILADGKKGQAEILFDVEKKNDFFTFKGVTGYMKYCYGCVYQKVKVFMFPMVKKGHPFYHIFKNYFYYKNQQVGSAIANVNVPDYYSFWTVKCVE